MECPPEQNDTSDLNYKRSSARSTSAPVDALERLQGVQAPHICVICLELAPDSAVLLPCHHDDFHFSCLGTWLHENPVCPLCKQPVRAVQYYDGPNKCLYHLQTPKHSARYDPSPPWAQARRHAPCRRRTRRRSPPVQDPAVTFRRQVYEKQMFSLYVGSNPYSGYCNVGPDRFAAEPELVAKAKKWIRRELQVFDFLDPNSSSFGRADRRATNAEFLLEYIVAILRLIDLKGSVGQAETLLAEFLGQQNTRLFLHELESWLRSPYQNLIDWDTNVQYRSPS